jgi:hypothetical protein
LPRSSLIVFPSPCPIDCDYNFIIQSSQSSTLPDTKCSTHRDAKRRGKSKSQAPNTKRPPSAEIPNPEPPGSKQTFKSKMTKDVVRAPFGIFTNLALVGDLGFGHWDFRHNGGLGLRACLVPGD